MELTLVDTQKQSVQDVGSSSDIAQGGGDDATKACFKCNQILPLSEFYRHPRMADGRLGKCKACAKADVTENRKGKVEQYREYDRARGNRQTPEYRRRYREIHKTESLARSALGNAVRDGRVTKPSNCEVCGRTLASPFLCGHHSDYAKPLDVVWCCSVCHAGIHAKLKQKGN